MAQWAIYFIQITTHCCNYTLYHENTIVVASYHVNTAFKGNINKVLLPTNELLILPLHSPVGIRHHSSPCKFITYGIWLSLKPVDLPGTSGKFTTCPQKHAAKISEGPDATVGYNRISKEENYNCRFSQKPLSKMMSG